MPLVFILLAWGILVVASLFIGHALRDFYVETASLEFGAGIRPMGLAFVLGTAGMISIVFGGLCALIGAVLSLKRRQWLLAAIAIMTFVVCWVPLYGGRWESYKITESHLLEPEL